MWNIFVNIYVFYNKTILDYIVKRYHKGWIFIFKHDGN